MTHILIREPDRAIERMMTMRKRYLLLLMAVYLLAQCCTAAALAQGGRDPKLQAAFENNALALRETQLVTDYTSFELRASAAAYAQMAELEETAPAHQADGAWVSLEPINQEFNPKPCFFSPDGSKAILMYEEHAYVLAGKVITMILPNYTRGVIDSYASFARFAKLPPAKWVDSEGITWSPDGRYAVLTNYKMTLITVQHMYSLYIIDTQTGELFCADTYPGKIMDGGAGVFQACFDASGRYLYYMLYGSAYDDSRVSLMRYDMQTNEKQRLLACPRMAAYPKLQRDSKGRLVNLLSPLRANEFSGLSIFEEKDGKWSIAAFEIMLPAGAVHPTYMEIGSLDMGVMLHTVRFSEKVTCTLAGRFFADDSLTGYDELLLIEDEDAQRASVLPFSAYGDGSGLAEKITRGELLQCLNIKLSPDGHYALLLMMNAPKRTFSFLMMDMETLALRPVQAPAGAASMYGGGSLPFSVSYPAGFGWFAGNKLVLHTEDGLKLYEFVY